MTKCLYPTRLKNFPILASVPPGELCQVQVTLFHLLANKSKHPASILMWLQQLISGHLFVSATELLLVNTLESFRKGPLGTSQLEHKPAKHNRLFTFISELVSILLPKCLHLVQPEYGHTGFALALNFSTKTSAHETWCFLWV